MTRMRHSGDGGRTAERSAETMPAEPSYFSARVSGSRRFYLRLAPGRGRPLTVVSGGWEQCRPDYAIRRPGFPHPTLEFVARGAGELRLGGETWALAPGVAFVYGRGVPHRIRTDPSAPMLKYFVVFAGAEGRALLRTCGLRPGTACRVARTEPVQQVFDDLIDHALDDHPDRQRLCGVALEYLITRIDSLAVPFDEGGTQALATYQRCRAYIETEYLRVQSLRDIATACHADGAYICRLFRRYGRESPIQFLRHLRMNRAVDLLLNHNRMVKEVAADLGFSDTHNFSRAFRHAFGVSPARLKKT
ncbi:MAG: AraC family transcriptional regulator [Verrucomicrobia bacterium]|nr:AraC family transcriptional regulator [Verrucomicrobiota bacterium]